jgi:hypothetical protein
VEKDSSSLADVVEEMSKLKNIFSGSRKDNNLLQGCLTPAEVRKAEDIFEKRNSESKIQTIHYLANLLHPKYRGETFGNDEMKMRKVLNMLNVYAEDIGVVRTELDREELGRQLSCFRMKEEIFETKLLSHRDASMFWENHKQFASCNKLATIGARILSIPASSASVERSFSEQGHLHNKSRNRITDINVDKLMRIKWSLKQDEQYAITRELSQPKVHNAQETTPDPDVASNAESDNEDDVDIDDIIDLDTSYTEEELLEIVGLA